LAKVEKVLKELRDLEKQTNQNIVSEMVTEFIIDAGKGVGEMRAHLEAKKYMELAKISHTLKSSSANIGAVEMSKICSEIENLIVNEKKMDFSQLNILVSEIEGVLPTTLNLLKAA
jgi:HPt (histidine-containing phosphotransfer) domain-containing protein